MMERLGMGWCGVVFEGGLFGVVRWGGIAKLAGHEGGRSQRSQVGGAYLGIRLLGTGQISKRRGTRLTYLILLE